MISCAPSRRTIDGHRLPTRGDSPNGMPVISVCTSEFGGCSNVIITSSRQTRNNSSLARLLNLEYVVQLMTSIQRRATRARFFVLALLRERLVGCSAFLDRVWLFVWLSTLMTTPFGSATKKRLMPHGSSTSG